MYKLMMSIRVDGLYDGGEGSTGHFQSSNLPSAFQTVCLLMYSMKLGEDGSDLDQTLV